MWNNSSREFQFLLPIDDPIASAFLSFPSTRRFYADALAIVSGLSGLSLDPRVRARYTTRATLLTRRDVEIHFN